MNKMTQCEICKEDKQYFSTYITRGLSEYQQHDICKECMKKYIGNVTPKRKAEEFSWASPDSIVEDPCMHCGEETKQCELHSFFFNGFTNSLKTLDDRWYNFCSKCAEKDFYKLIMILNI